MSSTESSTPRLAVILLVMAFKTIFPAGPAVCASEPEPDRETLKARVLAALARAAEDRDEITPAEAEFGELEPTDLPRAAQPEPASLPPATQPATQPADDTGDEVFLVPPDIQVNPDGRVEMHVRNLDLGSVLQMLSMQAHRNIVASKKVTGTVTANLYSVTFTEALNAVLSSNGAAWREEGNFIHVYTNEEMAAIEAAQSPPVTRVFRLHYISAIDAEPLVAPLLSNSGKVTSGGKGEGRGKALLTAKQMGLATSKEEAGGNSVAQDDCLVLTDFPERLEQVAKLLADIDVRPKQVLIEATILRALLNEDNALGIDFNMVHGVNFRALAGVSSAGTDLTLGQLPSPQLNDSTLSMNTDFRAQVPDGGFTFGFIKNEVAVFIRALEQVTDTTVLANPKVLALNKQRGEVIVGRRDGYLTTTVTQTAAVQSVEFLETGTRLIFRPFIGDDGYIRLEVHPEDSTGGVTAANLPFEQTTEVTTNIMVRDGNTVLIGGLFRESTTGVRGQLPLVGNVPIAGALFRNTHDTTQREEIIILLTVHVIKDDAALAEASADAIQDVERLRVGMRQGLQWFGRERLAQAHYRWAMEHLEKGRPDCALWDLDLAINNNPKFLAAIKLKEELIGRREWDEESSLLRDFVTRQIQREQGREGPEFGRPEPGMVLPNLLGPVGFSEPGDPSCPDVAAVTEPCRPTTTAPAEGDE